MWVAGVSDNEGGDNEGGEPRTPTVALSLSGPSVAAVASGADAAVDSLYLRIAYCSTYGRTILPTYYTVYLL